MFSRVAIDASGENAIYRRTVTPDGRFRRDPALFEENLVHASRLLRAEIGGQLVAPGRYGPDLPFLREQALTRTLTKALVIDLSFATHDEDVHGLFVGAVSSQVPATMRLTLHDESGREVLRRSYAVQTGQGAIHDRFPPGLRARVLAVTIEVPAGETRITLGDLRLEGQSAALGKYVRTRLAFR